MASASTTYSCALAIGAGVALFVFCRCKRQTRQHRHLLKRTAGLHVVQDDAHRLGEFADRVLVRPRFVQRIALIAELPHLCLLIGAERRLRESMVDGLYIGRGDRNSYPFPRPPRQRISSVFNEFFTSH